ncbi:MAG: site-specific DNA-methyltransferase [Clostridiaceae bacterium]|nr:site-specific DNA-methyltransferase [Clostridiaceae bacterium]
MLEKYYSKYGKNNVNAVIIDISRALDKEVTEIINIYKDFFDISINSVTKEDLRDYIYYSYLFKTKKEIILPQNQDTLHHIVDSKISKAKIDKCLTDSIAYMDSRMNTSESEKENILSSIDTRISLISNDNTPEINKLYQNYISKMENNYVQLALYYLTPSGNEKSDFNKVKIFLNDTYENLQNYHYAVMVFENNDKYNFTWSTIAKSAIYAENFRQRDDFPPYIRNLKKQKASLCNFLINNECLEFPDTFIPKSITENFYKNQSYGYIFTDLFVSNCTNQKILVLEKIEYDNNNVPCPDCFDMNPRGNSYKNVMFKSFECSNPYCKSRSKSGRGKRYNYLSAKLQHKKNEIQVDDIISEELNDMYRKDIIDFDENVVQNIISLYSFSNDNVLIYTDKSLEANISSRKITKRNSLDHKESIVKFYDLPIYNLIKNVLKYKKSSPRNIELDKTKNIIIENKNSNKYLSELIKDQYTYAITSPPYYNAREYSQWPNLLCYLVDMSINIQNVFETISENGIYLYNIGDVVDQDNIYVSSTMSRRRQIIGLYSVLLFELSGWSTNGNIIWDKGEVQSKRNSNSDRLPYYVKPINCYEHIWIFTKNKSKGEISKKVKFSPVIKIRKGGENIAKHTAPYPLELVNLIQEFLFNSDRILDPYLGSGTTALWCLRNNKKCLGLEISEEYYQVALNRINESYYNISLFDFLE